MDRRLVPIRNRSGRLQTRWWAWPAPAEGGSSVVAGQNRREEARVPQCEEDRVADVGEGEVSKAAV